MAEHNDLGNLGEERAQAFLRENGYKIKEINWRKLDTRFGTSIPATRIIRTIIPAGINERKITPSNARKVIAPWGNFANFAIE